MKDFEEVAAEGLGRDDQEKGATGAGEGLRVREAAVAKGDEGVAKRRLVGRRELAQERLGEDVGGVGGKRAEDRAENGVGEVAVGPILWGRESGAKDARQNVLGGGAVCVEQVAEVGLDDEAATAVAVRAGMVVRKRDRRV